MSARLAPYRIFLFLPLVAVAGGEPLGTLFFTPAERAAIVATREGKSPTETISGLTVNGIVKRDTGKGTVWINRQAIPEGQPLPSSAARPTITPQGIAIGSKPVRVGETLNTTTSERSDLLPPGALTNSRAKHGQR